MMEPEKVARVSERIIVFFPRIHEETDAFRVLISTIISQRNRDEVTERISEKLFGKYPTYKHLSVLEPEALHPILRESGMYRQKSRWIVEIAKRVDQAGGVVPSHLEALLEYPGVGRKTANIVLSVSFGIPALAVDTHVHRISNRIGFVQTKTPEKTEEALTRLLPSTLWGPLNGSMVEMGKAVCKPIKPVCANCPVFDDCEWTDKIG